MMVNWFYAAGPNISLLQAISKQILYFMNGSEKFILWPHEDDLHKPFLYKFPHEMVSRVNMLCPLSPRDIFAHEYCSHIVHYFNYKELHWNSHWNQNLYNESDLFCGFA
jgi:hypothetical protein